MSKRGRGRGRGRGRDPTAVLPSIGTVVEIPALNDDSSDDGVSSLQASPGSGHGSRKSPTPSTDSSSGVSLTSSPSAKSDRSSSGSSRSSALSETDDLQILLAPNNKSGKNFAVRPGFGQAGRTIQLISNYFKLSCSQKVIYHYDVEVTSLSMVKKYGSNYQPGGKTRKEACEAFIPKVEQDMDRSVGKMKRSEIFYKLVEDYKLSPYAPVFDGMKNVFTCKPLPDPFSSSATINIKIDVNGRMREYQISIQPVRKANMTNEIDVKTLMSTPHGRANAMLAMNSIIFHREQQSSQIQVGRSMFYLSQPDKLSFGDGLEVWYGYNQTVHMTHKGPAVVLNVAAKAFHKSGPVIDYINDVLGRGKDIRRGYRMQRYENERVQECLAGVKVTVTHLPYPRKYTIETVSDKSANEITLNYNGKNLSIAQYFQSKYRALQYPNLPCLKMKSTGNQTFVPVENCVVVQGQPKVGKLPANFTSKMIKETAIIPERRFKAISNNARCVQKESGQAMKNYKMSMDLEPLKLPGRVIVRPKVGYGDNRGIDTDDRGVWRMDSGMKFHTPSNEVLKWVVLCLSQNCKFEDVRKLANCLTNNGKKLGLKLQNPEIRFLDDQERRRLPAERALRECSSFDFAVIILNRHDRQYEYDEIKFIADYRLGFMTQCIEDKNLPRINDQFVNNVCLKINAKLGGVNHKLATRNPAFSKPVIVFGADAIHSPRGFTRSPSIAAVVGSLDPFPFRYKVAARVQDNPNNDKLSQEFILELRAMVKSILETFVERTKKRPEMILFFRDGVSEGQFRKVLDFEVLQIQRACQDIFGCLVPITFVVVQKRHQTRFRPQNPRDGVGRGGNVPPGTTVDTDVTDPQYFDYFLNSHEGIQGTAKPAHYTVLLDENNFDPDAIQKLSFDLCFTYSKCNRSISIPAPVMYADLACTRAKKYADFHTRNGQSLPQFVSEAINSMGQFRNDFFFL